MSNELQEVSNETRCQQILQACTFYNLKKEDIKNIAVFPSNILFSCFVVQMYYTWQLLPLTTEDGSFCPCQLRTLRVLNNGGRKKIK